MTLSYIFHSGFAVETELAVLIFDFWMDPAHTIAHFSTTKKHIYVFSSHFHEDHFNNQVFRWRDTFVSNHITYILSKDILKRGRAAKNQSDVWLAKGGVWQDDNIRVIAAGSNDSGVSWIVETEGKRIFHAGDLCNWYARFLSEEKPPEQIISEEFGLVNPIAEEKRYLGELKDVSRLMKEYSSFTPVGSSYDFDVAFFPVDGRIGNGYTLGGRQFIERFKVELFVPMHFVASGFESAWRMEPFCKDRNISFWSIRQEGEQLHIMDNIIIRKSAITDIPLMHEVFAHARMFMAQTGNPNQWAETYPSEEQLHNDIDSGDSYVCIAHGTIIATFVLRGGIDPTYNNIYEGKWLNEKPYATIHRIASLGVKKGIFTIVLKYAMQYYDTIRIDTHRDNRVMRHLLDQHGFQYCGIIHCWNGDERLAFMR